MQRLFSTFANGWPGKGLLLQRLVTAAVLLFCAFSHLKESPQHVPLILHSLAAVAGMALLFGIWTPIIGVVISLLEVGIIFLHQGDLYVPLLLATIGITLAIIGPGAWSVDARLFGRKHFTIHDR